MKTRTFAGIAKVTDPKPGRRILALGVAVALSASLLAGCASSDSDSDQVALTYLTQYSGEQLDIMQKAADAFNEANPDVKVSMETVPYANMLSTIRTRAAGETGPVLMDIYDAWLPELIRDEIAAAAPEDNVKDLNDNFSEGAVRSSSSGGVVYAYPYEISAYAMIYNKRLFAEAGIEAPPTTWDEVLDYAQRLTKPGQQGIGLITSWQNGTVHPFLSWAASNGVELLADGSTTETNLDAPEMIEVAEFYQSLIDAGVVDPTMNASNESSTGDYLQNFAAGKTAMLPMANWIEGSLIDSMGEDTFFADVGVAPMPVGPSGSDSIGVSYSWLTVVNSKASEAKQDAAWRFLAFLNGPDSGTDGSSAHGDMEISMGALPVRLSDLEAKKDLIDEDPFKAGFAAVTPDAVPFPAVLGGLAATDALAYELEAVIFGTKTAAQAMADAKTNVEAALAEANR